MIARLGTAAINHVLMQNGWALERLSRFSGKTVRFDIAPFSISLAILPDGRLGTAEGEADAQCLIPPSLLPRLALHDELAYREIEGTGDTALLSEILFLARNLRWDAAEDLSHATGDLIAERIVQAAQGIGFGSSFLSLASAASEYLTEEERVIAKPGQLHAYSAAIDELRNDTARLEARIRRLEGK